MFTFNTTLNSSSTQTNLSKYEEQLINILSLPLQTSSRQLAAPYFSQNNFSDQFFCGEQLSYTQFSNQPHSLKIKPINELNLKLNMDSQPNWSENTHGEFCDTPTTSPPSEIDGLICIKKSTKIKPNVWTPQKDEQIILAKVEDMPVEVQIKKGLLGLNFKIYKTSNPKTNRMCTKFVCTYENWGKLCENKWSFLDHHRHHTGQRPYVWDVCEKRFTQRGNLRQHSLLHK